MLHSEVKLDSSAPQIPPKRKRIEHSKHMGLFVAFDLRSAFLDRTFSK